MPPKSRFVLQICAWILVSLFALALRWSFLPNQHSTSPRRPHGVDEQTYANFSAALHEKGWTQYQKLIQDYAHENTPVATPPPTRLLLIGPGAILQILLNDNSPRPLAIASLVFDTLFILAVFMVLFRRDTSLSNLAVGMAVGFSPLAIGMARWALGDVFSAEVFLVSFWAWLRGVQGSNNRWVWLGVIGWTLGLLIKEAHWIFVPSLFGVLLYLKYQKKTVPLWYWGTPLLPLLLGLFLFAGICGNFSSAWLIYTHHLSSAMVNPYATKYLDGPWYRYLVDYVIISPATTLCWIAAFFAWRNWVKNPWLASNLILGVGGLVVFSLIPHHFNLRYTIACDLALRIVWARTLAPELPKRLWWTLVIATFLIDLTQFQKIFVDGKVFDPVTYQLLWSLKFFQ
jgi:hypothetical protein